MTRAVCIHCGATKIGAFSPCASCRRDIATPIERAQSLLLSDRNLSRDELDQVAAKIRDGERPTFDDAQVAELAAQIAAGPEPSRFGLMLLVVLVLGAFSAIAFMVIYAISRLF